MIGESRNPGVHADDRLLERLLGRPEIPLEEQEIREGVEGRAFLVTGAAGSIGSELCRQIARLSASRLVLLDCSEGGLFDIDAEIRGLAPELDVISLLSDIRDRVALDRALADHRVDVLIHAAAYKHVSLMERHVVEAVHNNVIGTWNVVQAACRHGVDRFLLISSDKAVNPASVMGATKRLAELIVTSPPLGAVEGFLSSAVRFGNVLGSRGSVVPIFRDQIASGGPVTVTHADVRRFFLSVREAALLVLGASTLDSTSGIFVFDMGDPVRILDLAHRMIHLTDGVPNPRIEVRIVGLRPGEKLFEELLFKDESPEPTRYRAIRCCRASAGDASELLASLEQLTALVGERDTTGVLRILREQVPEYVPA